MRSSGAVTMGGGELQCGAPGVSILYLHLDEKDLCAGVSRAHWKSFKHEGGRDKTLFWKDDVLESLWSAVSVQVGDGDL